MWTEGTIQVGTSTFHYWVKHYEEPSIFGYEEGRASKITLRRNAETVFNFDRGLDVPPADAETKKPEPKGSGGRTPGFCSCMVHKKP